MSFDPNWKLSPVDALAVHLKVALTRRSVSWGTALFTDEQWAEMCQEIIDGVNGDKTADALIIAQSDLDACA